MSEQIEGALSKEEAIRCINEESEFTGIMPDELWAAIQSSKEAAIEVYRTGIRLAKANMIKRVVSAPAVAPIVSGSADPFVCPCGAQRLVICPVCDARD